MACPAMRRQFKRKIRNPKSEIRKKSQTRNPKSKPPAPNADDLVFVSVFGCGGLEWLSDFGFRISDFGFRISGASRHTFASRGRRSDRRNRSWWTAPYAPASRGRSWAHNPDRSSDRGGFG